MKGLFNMEVKYKEVKFTEEEFIYIKNVIYNLANVENKIPKGIKSKNSIILKQLNSRFSRMVF